MVNVLILERNFKMDSKNSFLFLSCDGDETREYRDLLTVDPKITQMGIHVVHFENESSPVALILLIDDYTPDPLYENDAKLNNLLGSSNSDAKKSTETQQQPTCKEINLSEKALKEL